MSLEQFLDELIASCPCDACERYRRWFVARAATRAVWIEQSLRSKR